MYFPTVFSLLLNSLSMVFDYINNSNNKNNAKTYREEELLNWTNKNGKKNNDTDNER